MRCFASLFVAPHRVEKIIQGSDLSQLVGNPNVLLYAYRTHHHEQIRRFLALPASTLTDKATYNHFARRCSRMSSRCGLSSLVGDLMRIDEEAAFPRILFVSLVWVSQDDHKNLREVKAGEEQQFYDLSDHKFTLIKHSNEHFQLVQGYMKGSGKESDRLGLGLKSCQEHTSNAFASQAGFSKRGMKSFLSKLKHFVEDDFFCRDNYHALFGVDLLNEGIDRAYWPSVSHTELLDGNIKGGGERTVGDLLESRLFAVAAQPSM